ncbi:MAG: hypothetical protein JJU41_09680 [Bacteroidetes bacterium]|nr:hypothetical protein [Bacteroidota bacterium]
MNTKYILNYAAALLLVSLTLQACSDSPTASDTNAFGIEARGGNGNNAATAAAPTAVEIPVFVPECEMLVSSSTLWAGQNTDAGTVTASYADGELTITFNVAAGYTLLETHLEVSGTAPARRGAPGQYANNGDTEDGVTYVVAVTEGQTVYVLAHAVVSNDETGATDTAYAGTIIRNGAWFGVFGFSAVTPTGCDDNQECIEFVKEETAYAGTVKGFQPWFWNAEYNGSATIMDIHAGNNGTKIGTASFSDEDANGNVTITFEFNEGWGFATVDVDGKSVKEALKIQGYNEAPTSRQTAGLFTTLKSDGAVSVTVPSYPFYQIHIDAGKATAVACAI